MDDELFTLWAKTNRDSPGSYHPLLFHMLDVAEVAGRLWGEIFSRSWTTERGLAWGLSRQQMQGWVALLAGLHDLGKASPVFQGMDEAVRGRLSCEGFSFPEPLGFLPHGQITAKALEELLPSEFGMEFDLAEWMAACVAGHHGVFPRAADLAAVSPIRAGRGRWQSVRRDLLRSLAGLVGCSGARPVASQGESDSAFFMVLAGLTCVADWIGSNEAWFPLSGGVPQAEYLPLAKERARHAVDVLHWTGFDPGTSSAAFGAAFPECAPPRPLQEYLATIMDRDPLPRLILVEAPMGEGKTEAALHTGQAWMARNREKGMYVALPTMATSNQMFRRVKDFVERRYPDQRLGYMLLHGQALLSEDFKEVRVAGVEVDRTVEGGAPGGVLASEWFLKGKRGLLVPFGVGTIDQGLMSVLQTRHFFVRLFGLAHKTVVLDEVHAYDAYMSVLMERLLSWLSALDCTVLLLSATLPGTRRKALAESFAGPIPSLADQPYPRVTTVGSGGVSVAHVPSVMSYETALVHRPYDEEGLARRLRDALAQGGCATVICNTVNRAQEVYGGLRPFFAEHEFGLFHARFPQEDRQRIEGTVLSRFGPPSGEGVRPHRFVLVATQVIEQSLDLDFDLMVSELAPADLLLQRMGRLHRHQREGRPPMLSRRFLWILGPRLKGQMPSFESGSQAVYGRHLLLRTWLALKDRTVLRVPTDVETLVEAVYGDRVPPDGLDEGLARDWNESKAALDHRRELMESKARTLCILPPDHKGRIWEDRNLQLQEDDPDTHPALQALTRLSEAPNVQAVCLFARGERVFMDVARSVPVDLGAVPSLEQQAHLLGRSVTLSSRRVAPWLLDHEAPPAAWTKTALLRHHRALVFDEDSECHLGDENMVLRLDPELGLTWR